jgi:hypothetical protein
MNKKSRIYLCKTNVSFIVSKEKKKPKAGEKEQQVLTKQEAHFSYCSSLKTCTPQTVPSVAENIDSW